MPRVDENNIKKITMNKSSNFQVFVYIRLSPRMTINNKSRLDTVIITDVTVYVRNFSIILVSLLNTNGYTVKWHYFNQPI